MSSRPAIVNGNTQPDGHFVIAYVKAKTHDKREAGSAPSIVSRFYRLIPNRSELNDRTN